MRGAILGVCLLLAGACHAHVPVGIRANNPGNIHGVHVEQWAGAVGTDSYHYLRFATPLDGLRAMRLVMRAYWTRYGICTVSGLVNRWVRKPHGKRQIDDLRQYLLLVSRRMGVEPNQTLAMMDPFTEERLAKAIVYAENGEQPYPDSLYRQAFQY